MATCVACIVCLKSGVRMVDIQSTYHIELYQIMVQRNIFLEIGMPNTVCSDCHRRMQRSLIFGHVAKNCRRLALERAQRDSEEAGNNVVANLSTTPTEDMSVNMNSNTSTADTVSVETVLVEEEQDAPLEQQGHNGKE